MTVVSGVMVPRGRRVSALVSLGIVVLSVASALSLSTAPPASASARSSYIVTLRTANDAQLFRTRMNSSGGVVTEVLDSVFNGVIADLTAAQVVQMRRDPRVVRIESNKVVRTAELPPSWGLDRVDQRALPLDSSFSIDARWGGGVTVYIVDTGINLGHSEFSGRLLPGHDVLTIGGNGDDCNGHGTHVAGTVAGATYGIARSARLVPVRVLDCLGGGGVTTGRVDTGAVGGAVGRGSGLVGGIGRLPGTHVESTYSSPFGDAGPALVTTPRVEAPTRPAETSAGVDAVHTLRYAAATPATCGDAIDVPEMVLLAPGPPTHALVMEEPGANRSRHEPKLENVDR